MTILEGNVVFEEDSSMEFKVDKAGNGAISVEENVLGDFTIPVSFSGEGPGKWLVMEAASIEPDFVSATSGVHLSLEANGTQLWAERFDPVTVITVK
ncbi:MAG: hypothetical protein GX804_11060 [Lentisphaerae bacterium]|nr:hypothetical protein [Lentisphaerota bacterium]